jgi:hypothetical protein
LWGDFLHHDSGIISTTGAGGREPLDPNRRANVATDIPLSSQSATSTPPAGNSPGLSNRQRNETTKSDSQLLQRRKPSKVPLTEKYFELCVNIGEWETELNEIEIATSKTNIETDGQLFREIRKRYEEKQTWPKRLASILKPIDVRLHFVKVRPVTHRWKSQN